MNYPENVSGKEIIVGGGVHAAIYAATRAAIGKEKPIVLESGSDVGGVFAKIFNFPMNSTNQAGIRSVATGPSRMLSESPTDDLNYLPNAAYQVSQRSPGLEYPMTSDMAFTVRRNLNLYAEVYANTVAAFNGEGYRDEWLAGVADDTLSLLRVSADGTVYRVDRYGDITLNLGRAKRVIVATGLSMGESYSPTRVPDSPAFMRADKFYANPLRNTDQYRIAVVGAGDTASTIMEYLLGMNYASQPYTLPRVIDWYGGATMPMSKKAWTSEAHARYLGLARAFPEKGVSSVLTPYAERGSMRSLGNIGTVNGRRYDKIIVATGYKPADTFSQASDFYYGANDRSRECPIARCDNYSQRLFKIGACAQLPSGTEPYISRFPATSAAIYRLAPLTAELACTLP